MKKTFSLSLMIVLLSASIFAQKMASPVNVSNTEGTSRWGQVAFAPNGVAHIVWEDNYRIAYLSYNGTGHSAPYYLKTSTDVFAAEPCIAATKDGSIYVGWMENDTAGDEHGLNFMMRQYDPQARVWLDVEVVAESYLEHEPPAIAVDSFGNIYCAWTNYAQGISNTRCKINGNWGPVTRMNVAGGRGKYTTIASGPDDRIWCVWGEKDSAGNYKTHYSFRTKDEDWAPKEIMNSTAGDQDRPNIAVDPTTNIPHVVFINIDEVTGHFRGAVIICKIDGLTNPLETAIPEKLQHYAKLTIDRYGNKHVATQTGPGDAGTGIQYTNNIGGKWKGPVGMTNASGRPKLPGIATDGRNVGLIWDSYISDANKEIWFTSLYPVTVHNVYPPTDRKADLAFGEAGAASKITYNLSWKADSRNASSLKNYKIYSKASSSEPYNVILTVAKTTLQASFSYAQINRNISFAITAVDTNGYESELKEFPIIYPVAQAPLGMKLTVLAKGVFKNPQIVYQLDWENNPDNPENFIQSYNIFWKDPGANYVFLSQLPGTSTTASYTSTNTAVRKSFGISMITAMGEETAVVPFGSATGASSSESPPIKILKGDPERLPGK